MRGQGMVMVRSTSSSAWTRTRDPAEWVVANARKFEEVELDVKGETDEELAASLVAEMLRTGLTAKG
jgi:hypothetical protein